MFLYQEEHNNIERQWLLDVLFKIFCTATVRMLAFIQ